MIETTIIEALLAAKAAEEEAKARRVALETEIAQQIATRHEGTDKVWVGNFIVTVTSKLTRSLDYAAYQEIEHELPEEVRCVVKYKPELDLKKLRALEFIDPGSTAQFITTKPAKPSIKIELLVA